MCIRDRVYTVVAVDNTRRLQSAFSQFLLGHVDRSNDCPPTLAGVQIKDRLARQQMKLSFSAHVLWNSTRERFLLFCQSCQVMPATEPSMFLESPCNDFWWPLYCDYSGKLETNQTSLYSSVTDNRLFIMQLVGCAANYDRTNYSKTALAQYSSPKRKVVPYLITSVGHGPHGADPSFLAVSPQS